MFISNRGACQNTNYFIVIINSLTASAGDFKYFYNPCYGVSMDVESGSCTGPDNMAVSGARLLMITRHNYYLSIIILHA